jgi:hypothetical protein
MDEKLKRLSEEIDRQDRMGDYTKLLPLTIEYLELTAVKYGKSSAEYASVLNDLGELPGYRTI